MLGIFRKLWNILTVFAIIAVIVIVVLSCMGHGSMMASEGLSGGGSGFSDGNMDISMMMNGDKISGDNNQTDDYTVLSDTIFNMMLGNPSPVGTSSVPEPK